MCVSISSFFWLKNKVKECRTAITPGLGDTVFGEIKKISRGLRGTEPAEGGGEGPWLKLSLSMLFKAI